MRKLRLMNVYLHLNLNDQSDYFKVDKYNFYPPKLISFGKTNFRKHKQNAFVEFNGKQEDSILFSGGVFGDKDKPQKRKLIDDILVIGSILTGWNWELYSRKNYKSYPLAPTLHLENIELRGKCEIEECFQKAMIKIKDASWQRQFENGFHLRMLLNHANITQLESRFLSNIVIWEWLYPHLKNPNGATPDDESLSLKEIMSYILDYFWQDRRRFKGGNIFHVLRNQFAHSGRLPINIKRCGGDDWMAKIEFEQDDHQGIKDYIKFFENLTQIIVLKTLDINVENIIGQNLNGFLSSGKLHRDSEFNF